MSEDEQGSQTESKPTRGGLRRVVVIIPLLLVLAAAAYWAFWRFRSHPVLVVNGLPVPYMVSLNGHTINLAPNGQQWAALRQGNVTVTASGQGISIPSKSFDLRVPLWKSARHATVINPDRLALFVLSSQQYGEYISRPADSPQTRQSMAGQLVYQIDPVDLFFQPLPVKAETGWKWQLDFASQKHMHESNPTRSWLLTIRQSQPAVFDQRNELLERRLATEPVFAQSFPRTLDEDLAMSFQPVVRRLGYVPSGTGSVWTRADAPATTSLSAAAIH